MKKHSALPLVLIALFAFAFISCNTLGMMGAEKVKPEEVYGSWMYQRENSSGILLTINSNGRYYYEEFGTREQVVFAKSGKYSLRGNTLTLKDINSGSSELFDDERPENVNISFVIDKRTGERRLRMVTTVARSYDMVRVDQNRNPIADPFLEPSTEAVSLSDAKSKGTLDIPTELNGLWKGADGISLVISGEDVSVIEGGVTVNAKITSIDGNTLSLEFDDLSYGEAYSSVVFVILDDTLTVIIPSNPDNPLVFTR